MGYRSRGASLSRDFTAVGLADFVYLEVRNVEILKWIGLITMLADHTGRYVFGVEWVTLEALGSVTFPLFAIALGAGLDHKKTSKGWDTCLRLFLWFGAAEWARWLCLPNYDFSQLNVLGTFAAGVLLFLSFAERPFNRMEGIINRSVGVVFAGFVGMFCEFGHVGVLMVAACCWWQRGGGYGAFAGVGVALALLPLYNQMLLTPALALVIAVLVSMLPADLPRVRGGFYESYVAQYPALAVVRWWLT